MNGYGTVQRLFHWSVTLLVLITIPIAIAMTSEGFREIGNALYVAHKGLGVVILALVVLRLLWRLAIERRGEDGELSARERWIASAGHVGLYVLLIGMGVTGYLRTVAGDFPIELLDRLGTPPLIEPDDALAARMSVAHAFMGYALVALIAAHIGAITHHAWVLRDGVARRMWPPVQTGGSDSDERSSEADTP